LRRAGSRCASKEGRVLRVNTMSRDVLATLQKEFPFCMQLADGTRAPKTDFLFY
jgi:hypothetical protein